MKRTLFILIICVFAVSMAQAQRAEVRKAERALNRGELAIAKEHIDLAIEEPTTSGEVGTWLLKAQVYMQIAMAEEPEVRNLVEDPVTVADEAATRAQSMEPSNVEIIQLQQMLMVLSELTYNDGVESFNVNDYDGASKKFLRSYELNKQFGNIDTTTYYNAGLAAELGENYDRAKTIYLDLMEMDHDQPYLFTSMATINLAEGDTAKALEYVLQGRERYPDDLNIIFNEANIYIFTGEVEKAKDILALAIEKDPENPGLYFALAANFDRMAQDTAYSHEERQGFYKQAETYYKGAIELDENFFDAIYNLGVLYFNEGIRLYEAADEALRKTQNFKQYEEDEKEIIAAWLKSQPYFEKARTLITLDDLYYETVIISLIQLYARTDQPEKLSEVEAIYLEHFAEEREENLEE
jgi:tetratricopeptide (TPR) repeat protein